MDTEKAGEPVFTNIDNVLTEKIISRSKENSKEPASEAEQMADEQTVSHNTGQPRSSVPVKWLAIVTILTLLLILSLLRGNSKNA